jgi:hypothetical protein
VAAMFADTVRATEEDAVNFHAVANDLTSTVSTFGRKCVDGTFETVEYVRFAVHAHLKTFVIFVPADLAFAGVTVAPK